MPALIAPSRRLDRIASQAADLKRRDHARAQPIGTDPAGGTRLGPGEEERDEPLGFVAGDREVTRGQRLTQRSL